ncbi:MAG: DUF4331 domain-containing protein [Myxococcota bacterium]
MKPLQKVVLMAATALMSMPGLAHASSHREAPAISEDPSSDNTDLYAWVTPGAHDKLYVIANWIPLEEPAGGPNFHRFSDDVLYAIHISRGDSLDDAVAYYIKFDSNRTPTVDASDLTAAPGGGKEFFQQLSGVTQTYKVVKVQNGRQTVIADHLPVAPINYGPRSQGFLNPTAQTYDDAFAHTFVKDMNNGEGRVFAGPRDDGFYVDLGGIFDLANLRAKGTAQDGVAGYNTHTIALEIPTTKLTANGQAPTAGASVAQTLGVWSATYRQKFRVLLDNSQVSNVAFGGWSQVSRLGLPLVNEALIGLQDKDKYNSTYPKNDVANFGAYFLNPVVVRDAEAVGIYTALAVPQATVNMLKSNRTDILNIISLNAPDRMITKIGDVLRVDMGTDSGFPNGRPIPGGAHANQEQADVTDVLLTVILSGGQIPISDGVDYNDKPFLTEFPFLALPWQGYGEGHGKPTP